MAKAVIPGFVTTSLFTPTVLRFVRGTSSDYPRRSQRQVVNMVRPLARRPFEERVVTVEDGLPVLHVGQEILLTSTADGLNVQVRNHYIRQCPDGQRIPLSMDMARSLDELQGMPVTEG